MAACACATEGRLYGYNEVREILERGDDAVFLRLTRRARKWLVNRRDTRIYVAVSITCRNHNRQTSHQTKTMETTNSKTAPIVHEKERNQVTLVLMHRMRLTGMANAFMESLSATYAEAMTPDAFISWLLAREWDYRSAAAIERLVKGAGFRSRRIRRK